MKDIKCIFCNVGSNRIVIEENGYKGRKCPQCGLIYVSPRPTFSQIVNLYTDDKASTYAESIIPNNYAKRLNAKYTLRIIRKYEKSGSMLEIGAGAGYFLDEARREGFGVYGIEPNKILAKIINNNLGIPCEKTPLDISSFDERKFDIIYHCNVLSHFYNPIAEFKKINSKLKDKGILVFETGNLGDVKEEYLETITKFDYPDHLFFFSEKSLKQLLELTGFGLMKIYKYSLLPYFLKIKILHIIRDIIKNNKVKKNLGNNGESKASFQNKNKFNFKQFIKKTNICFSYFLMYKIGHLMPKKGRPQTVIVVARKKT